VGKKDKISAKEMERAKEWQEKGGGGAGGVWRTFTHRDKCTCLGAIKGPQPGSHSI